MTEYRGTSARRAVAGSAIIVMLILIVFGSAGLCPSTGIMWTGTDEPVQLAYFYKPPLDGTAAATVATTAQFIVLTHNDEPYLQQVRDAGYTGKVLQYVLAAEVEGPGPYQDASAACDAAYEPLNNQVALEVGDFRAYIHPNEDWFLHNGTGERLSNGTSGASYRMNPNSAGWRQFALERMLRFLVGDSSRPPFGFDGIFLDNVELSWTKSQSQLTNSDGTIQEFATLEAFRSAWIGYLETLSQQLRSNGPLWANMISDPNDGSNWAPYMRHLDGGMFESFATGYGSGLSVTSWNNNLKQAESVLETGKGILAVSQGAQADTMLQSFAFASYLLVTGGQGYFRYTQSNSYRSWWLYDNYGLALGAPLNKRYQHRNTWRRDFTCGYVVADPVARTGEIVQTCELSSSDSVGSVAPRGSDLAPAARTRLERDKQPSDAWS